MMALALVGLILSGPVEITKELMDSTSLSSATAINSTAYTGWVSVPEHRSVSFEITYVNSAATAVTMKCWTSDNGSTANGSGFELHILSDSATVGTSTSVQHTWSNAVSGNESWTWTVSNLPHQYINCGFNGTSADGSDTVVVKRSRSTP